MNNQEVKELLEKYRNGLCAEEEKAWVESWYLKTNHSEDEISHEEIEAAMVHVRENLMNDDDKRPRWMWSRWAAAAIVLLCCGLGYYHLRPQKAEQTVQTSVIKPGTNKAFLTLANGRQINLSDVSKGQLAKESGTKIIKEKNGEVTYVVEKADSEVKYNTMATPKGGQWHLVLGDGTEVWLNAASSLRYPTVFTGAERKVELAGEGYFEVAHNAKMPFRVYVKGQTIEDLGTKFNVKAYYDEPIIKTTLIQGSVSINHKAILEPGQQALIANGKINVSKTNVEQALAWKDGYFIFNNANIEDMMKELKRWYDFDISYQGDMSNIEFQGNYLRSRNLFKLLKAIELTNKVKFKIEGRRVIAIAK